MNHFFFFFLTTIVPAILSAALRPSDDAKTIIGSISHPMNGMSSIKMPMRFLITDTPFV